MIATMTSSVKNVVLSVTEITSHVENTFCLLYLTTASTPRLHTICMDSMPCDKTFQLDTAQHTLGLVCMLFCSRDNDDGNMVTQYLGSSLLDISECKCTTYSLRILDSSSRPPLRTGSIRLVLKSLPTVQTHLKFQSKNLAPRMFSEAEANLKWISPFNSKGLPSITEGLKMVHSPYYVNHMGVTLPSGAFCMIPTMDDKKAKAIISHRDRLLISLKRNHMTSIDFIRIVADLMSNGVRSKHLRCLKVLADTLTLHARMNIYYTPDVELSPKPKGTERWEVPREPTLSGKTSFSGDCEDFAREVYQQAKEILKWVTPAVDKGILEAMSALLHLYVPTIEQGAVDSSAHSKYITYWAPYRNHIWAALHPRNAWKRKCHPSCSLKHLYQRWPEQYCENKLPMLHLEGTGDVFPIVTAKTPGYIARINKKKAMIIHRYPNLARLSTPDFSLQMNHKSTFYKYAIACMTDVFSEQGFLDFTYVSNLKYGVSIYDWARGDYQFRPSTKHSSAIMEDINELISLERPISAVTYTSTITHSNSANNVDSLRFGSKYPIHIP